MGTVMDFHKTKEDEIIHKLQETPDITAIVRDIPVVRGLDPSFWKDQGFLTWQVIRLNENCRNNILRSWKSPQLHNTSILPHLAFFFTNYAPAPNQTIGDWQKRLDLETGIISDRLRLILYRKSLPNESYPILPFSTFKVFRKSFNLSIPPISYHIRFPLPILLTEFNLPLGKGRGRPRHWAEDLLIYELFKAGKKDMEIARLLYGAKSSTNGKVGFKHPALVEIGRIKKEMEVLVSQSYPFPLSR